MNVWDDTTTSNGRLDESVQLFVSSDSELKMSWRDSLDLQILGGVSGQLEDLGGQVLKDGGRVDGGGSSDTSALDAPSLEVSVDTSNWELKSCLQPQSSQNKHFEVSHKKLCGKEEKTKGRGKRGGGKSKKSKIKKIKKIKNTFALLLTGFFLSVMAPLAPLAPFAP